MKVNQTQTNSAQQAEAAQKAQELRKAKAVESARQVEAEGKKAIHSSAAEISARAREMAQVKAAADGAPETREEKIAELKRRIQSGEYNVKPEAVADKMVSEHMKTHGVLGA